MTEPKTQYESMVDEDKQNDDLIKKYNLNTDGPSIAYIGYYVDTKSALDVIKKLEIDIFNLRESLKLSQELNEIYKKDIVDLKDKVCELNEEYD